MTHAGSTTPQDRRRREAQRFRVLFALLLMCLAVVPHVTLAASLIRMPMAVSAGHMSRAEPVTATKPCHEPTPVQGGHLAAAPACCIIGCGLIAQAAALALPSRMIGWSPPAPALAERLDGISTEPAKPPPRS